MSTRLYDLLTQKGSYGVGDLKTKWAKQLVNGAIVTNAKVDNYTIVELAGRDEDGNLTCKQLSDNTKKGYLVTTVEEEQLMNIGGVQETYTDFYNAIGEVARLTYLDEGLEFETSSFSKNTGVEAIADGMVAHFDVATKEFIVSDSKTPHTDYAGAKTKYEVTNKDSDFGYGLDVETIQLRVIE